MGSGSRAAAANQEGLRRARHQDPRPANAHHDETLSWDHETLSWDQAAILSVSLSRDQASPQELTPSQHLPQFCRNPLPRWSTPPSSSSAPWSASSSGYVPARRAAALMPTEALRYE